MVLGAAAWDARPSPVFKERIRHAVKLYKAGKIQAIVFTGGRGSGARFAESEVGRNFARGLGVPDEVMHIETKSLKTIENLHAAKRIADTEMFSNLLIVSDPLHMCRAMAVARHLDLLAAPSPTPSTRYRSFKTKADFALRETLYYGWFLVRSPWL